MAPPVRFAPRERTGDARGRPAPRSARALRTLSVYDFYGADCSVEVRPGPSDFGPIHGRPKTLALSLGPRHRQLDWLLVAQDGPDLLGHSRRGQGYEEQAHRQPVSHGAAR